MDPVGLSVERPVLLSPASRQRLVAARDRLREDDNNVKEDGAHSKEDEDVLERAYEEVTLRNRSDQLPLSVRLTKLWAERGDFSRFRASTLPVSEGADEGEDDFEKKWDLGAELNGLDVEKDHGQQDAAKSGDVSRPEMEKTFSKDVMEVEDMKELRTRMKDKLEIAQHALYTSHALVSLLINSTKAGHGSLSNPSAARAGSPQSNSAGAAAAGARGDTAASISAVQRGANANNVIGSAATLEAELGVEPHVFGASLLEARRRDVEQRAAEEHANDSQEESDEEKVENLDKETKVYKKKDEFLTDAERAEQTRNIVECYQAKKKGLAKARDILRNGAAALKGSDDLNGREAMRWRLLMQAKKTGWGLTPDKPLRVAKNNKRVLLEEYANRKREEPARDAWIGYAIPEAQATYKREALAYFTYESGSISTTSGGALAFALRPRKRLLVNFVGGDVIWTSDQRYNNAGHYVNTVSIEDELRQAQYELADAELFDAIVKECRATSSVAASTSMINSEDSVSFWLNGIEMQIKMVGEEVNDRSPRSDERSHFSSLALVALALLRLGLIRRYRSRAGITGPLTKLSGHVGTDEESSTPLLLPILGPIRYATFVARLHTILSGLAAADNQFRYDLDELEKLQDCQSWLTLLLQGATDSCNSVAMSFLGGRARVYSKNRLVALLTISYPSSLSLSLPLKRNAMGGRGVFLSAIDLRKLGDILSDDLQ